MTNLNARFSGNGSRVNSSLLPPPGTPRGVHGMSVEELALDMEKDADIEEKDLPKTKTKRTWYGKKKTVVVPDLEDGMPEPRPMMLYAPIYNGLAFGMSVCTSHTLYAPARKLC